jgi:crossover junction endodeoxyribonuclease RuvC
MRIGIDPGITGAIAVLNDGLQCLDCQDMPTMPLGVNHTQVNAAQLAKLIKHWGETNYKPNVAWQLQVAIYLEQVNAMPGQGVTSMFNFGMSYGVVIGICGTLAIPMVLVRPNAWKKVAGLIGKPKDAARTLAQQLYPEVDLEHKKDVGRADALLIARFGWMV